MPSQQQLRDFYVGQDVGDVPKPALVLDAAIIRRHCQAMIRAVKKLDVGFRAHVKSHKTAEIAEIQVGDKSLDGNFIASTVLEIETLVPLLRKLKAEGRNVNVLYGIPLVPSKVTQIAKIAREVGDGSIAVMIDHPAQIDYLPSFSAIAKFPASAFIKVDSGYHRAGLPPTALNKQGLLNKLADSEKQGHARLLGVYSHSSLSYSATTPQKAMYHLINEIDCCKEAIQRHLQFFSQRQLVISVGATPQALSSQNLLQNDNSCPEMATLRNLLLAPFSTDLGVKVKVELHAGVYPLLDMQQLSTNAGMQMRSPQEEVAISVLAEVCSVYNDSERPYPEALLAAGTLALGREPCPDYSGWAILSPWRQSTPGPASRLIVKRISQEHSIVTWEDKQANSLDIPLAVGQVVKLYPNHACVAASFYNFYFIVDSDQDPDAASIVDVWVRARGSDMTDSIALSRAQ
ncbi:putative serine dehydratase domain-containing protein [Aspergillus bertholletiae]|uniref:D-serine dehydratase n=1 Tax=Aspergillus bertholletiae TaxID=1226010 RepID=A0A5N7BFC9_9EURO|nr:putative serine dehydratase domain-containing protein [Aspergillus bertholletiae]